MGTMKNYNCTDEVQETASLTLSIAVSSRKRKKHDTKNPEAEQINREQYRRAPSKHRRR